MIYTSKFINIISFFLTLIIFFSLNFLISKYIKIPKTEIKEIIVEIKNNIKENNKKNNGLNVELGNWYIEIPEIKLKAPISEGTDMETLNTKVGHFEETSLKEGNIGLAAHNRGYEYNYFENLKKLKINDEIIYTYENYQKKYVVDKIEIIENTNWNYLEKTKENKITLITCIENEPNYRRCVQAIELKE